MSAPVDTSACSTGSFTKGGIRSGLEEGLGQVLEPDDCELLL